MGRPAPKTPSELSATTLMVQFASYNNPAQPYRGVLDLLQPDGFTMTADAGPAAGNLVLFTFLYGTQELVKGTAKIHSLTAVQDGKMQIELRISQADPKALADLEKLFNARQENIQEWLSRFRED